MQNIYLAFAPYLSTRFFSLVLIGILWLMSASQTTAQSTEFTYQGSLKDGVGLANGNYDFEFALFDALTAGAQVGSTVAQISVAVSNGIFSVSLDFGGQFPGASRYLEIRVRPSGGGSFNTLLPRQQIDSAPYAVRSLDAGTATNFTGTLSGDVVGSQSATIVERLRGRMVASTLPINGQVLTWNGTASQWEPGSFASSFIQNQNGGPQSSSNFNISGTGMANIFNAATQFNLGGNRLISNAGTDNLFVGVNAGASNTLGNSNSFFGKDAGSANTEASANSFFGSSSGKNNSVGVSNSFFGMHSGLQNTEGVQNSFFGALSGSATTTGGLNSFFGMLAGSTNTAGTENTIIGAFANVLSNNLTNASAIGSKAAVSQSNSLILGSIAGVNGAVSNTRVGIGVAAPNAWLHVTGTKPAYAPPLTNGISADPVLQIIGPAGGDADFNGGTGSNILIQAGNGGVNPFGPFTGGNGGSITIQPGVGGTGGSGLGQGGNAIISHASETSVLIGTSTPGAKLFVNNNLFQNGYPTATFAANIGTHKSHIQLGSTGDWYIRSSVDSGKAILQDTGGNVGVGTTTPQHKLHVDADTEILSTGSGAGFKFRDRGSTSSGDDWVWYSMGNIARLFHAGDGDRLTVTTGGVVAIGALGAAGATALCRNASNEIAGCSSSLRYKTNVAGFGAGMSFVNRLRPISFDWKTDGVADVGFGAEDVAKIDPRFVTYNSKGEIEGVKYDRLSVAFVNAFKEQQEQIVTLERRNAQQEREIDELKKVVCSIKADADICKAKEK